MGGDGGVGRVSKATQTVGHKGRDDDVRQAPWFARLVVFW